MYYLQYETAGLSGETIVHKLPLIIDYSVVKKECIRQGVTSLKNFQDLDLDSFESLENLCYFALQRGHKIEGQDFTLSIADVEGIFNSSSGDFIAIVTECMPKVLAPADSKKK
jgi:hypothetical protein